MVIIDHFGDPPAILYSIVLKSARKWDK